MIIKTPSEEPLRMKDQKEEIINEQEQETQAPEAKKTAEGKSENKEPSQAEETQSLEKKIEEISKEKEKIYENYLRTLADQENLRKRHVKEKEELIKYNSESLFKDLLPVLDSMEKAFEETGKSESEEGKLKSLTAGFDLIAKKLLQILEKNGLTPIATKEASYDPNLHQAIQTEKNADVKTPTIKKELMKGYELNGRLLRPSMVSVLLPDDETN